MQMQKQTQIYRGVFHTFTKIVKYETVSYIMSTDMHGVSEMLFKRV